MPGRRGRGLSEDATPFAPAAGDPLVKAVHALAPEIKEDLSKVLYTIRTRSVELAGFTPGDVAILDLNRRPAPGDVVCAQIYDWQKMRAETVVRVYERATPIELLVTRSLDPTLQQPVVVDGEKVVIKGVFLPHRLRAERS